MVKGIGKSKNSKTFWERAAFLYDRARRPEALIDQEITLLIKPYLKETDNVLELACGTGTLAGELAGRVRFWEATDYAENMISRAAKKYKLPSLHFSVRDAEALPYAQESFDKVILLFAMHLLPQPDVALAEIRRVLKPGGILIAPDYIYDSVRQKALRSVLLSLSGLRITGRYTAGGDLRLFTENGFIVTEHRSLHGRELPVCFVTAERT